MRDTSDRALIERLRADVRASLAELVPAGEPVALLDFPNHDNVGDAAIWLGQLAWLRAAGHELVYAADHASLSAPTLRRRLPRGTILLHGGGNFGDSWPVYQRFREHVLERFRGHRVVQLPQTVHFADEGAARRTAELIAAHPDFTLCVRDAGSERFARERLGARAALVCDMAFALGPLRPGPARHELLCLLRSDHERVEGRLPRAGVRVDWPEQVGRWWALRRTSQLAGTLGTRMTPLARASAPMLIEVYERLARERLCAGLELIGAGELLITDRLHGHIVALLAGVPQVLLDNSYGKLRGFWEAWTHAATTTRLADDYANAVSAPGTAAYSTASNSPM